MAHDHDHDHNDSTYFLEQLCTIGVCGALGGVVIIMWYIPNGLTFLGPQFQAPLGQPWLSPVLWGGVAVVTLVLIRAVAVWISVGRPVKVEDHSHDHDHGHDHCGHGHAHCDHEEGIVAAPSPGSIMPSLVVPREPVVYEHDHDHSHDHEHTHEHVHDHGHDHGWAPWRYIILLLPVGLYFLGLIPAAFSNLGTINTDIDDSGPTAAKKEGDIIRGFLELGRAAATEQSRKEYEGRTAEVVGQATNIETRRFGLIRYKISCCAADAVPLKMVISVPATTEKGKTFDGPRQLTGKWVKVTGVIQFRKLRDSDEYVTVLEVPAESVDVQSKTPENPFVY